VHNNPLSAFDLDGHCTSGGFSDLTGPCQSNCQGLTGGAWNTCNENNNSSNSSSFEESAQKTVVWEIQNFDKLVNQESEEAISAYQNSGSDPSLWPTALLPSLQAYANPQVKDMEDPNQLKNLAYNQVKDYFSAQLAAGINSQVDSILSKATNSDLNAFRGRLDGVGNKGLVGKGALAAQSYFIGKISDALFAHFSGVVQAAVGWAIPQSYPVFLTNETQTKINAALKQAP
jgi:hypothetical protein